MQLERNNLAFLLIFQPGVAWPFSSWELIPTPVCPMLLL
jgi:hypothetical protein